MSGKSKVARQVSQPDTGSRSNACAVQVEHDAGQGDGKGMSFRNTWLRSLGVRLPTLALAVDDALIGFAERLANILGAPPAVTPLPTGDAQGAPSKVINAFNWPQRPHTDVERGYHKCSANEQTGHEGESGREFAA